MKRVTLFLIFLFMAASLFSAEAVVMSGSATVRAYNDNMKAADSSARAGALMNALQNYFGSLQEDQPEQAMPQITPQYFKFIRSYRITDRHYEGGSVTYSVIADIDRVSLSDVAAMMKVSNSSAVFIVRGIPSNPDAESKINSALSSGGFSTGQQADFVSSLVGNDTASATDAFQNSSAQYLFDILIEPVSTGTKCSAGFTVKVYSKDKDFNPIKINGEGTGSDANNCLANAAAAAMPKIMGYIHSNYVPSAGQKQLQKIEITAANYSNFAAPKNLMEELKKRTFITSYAVKGFAEKSLDMEAEAYISADMLLKKLQAIAKQYNFTVSKTDDGNILLDFSGAE